jgi:hypothetical protein
MTQAGHILNFGAFDYICLKRKQKIVDTGYGFVYLKEKMTQAGHILNFDI